MKKYILRFLILLSCYTSLIAQISVNEFSRIIESDGRGLRSSIYLAVMHDYSSFSMNSLDNRIVYDCYYSKNIDQSMIVELKKTVKSDLNQAMNNSDYFQTEEGKINKMYQSVFHFYEDGLIDTYTIRLANMIDSKNEQFCRIDVFNVRENGTETQCIYEKIYEKYFLSAPSYGSVYESCKQNYDDVIQQYFLLKFPLKLEYEKSKK